MADGREDDRAPRAARRAHRHAAHAGANDSAAVALAHATRIARPGARAISMAVANAEPVGRPRAGAEPPGIAGTRAVAPGIARTGANTQRRTGTPTAALGAAETGAITHSPARLRGLVEGISHKGEMVRGTRGGAANDRVPDGATRHNGIAHAAAHAVGIAIAAAFADGMAITRTSTQNIAMTGAGANRIAGAGTGAQDGRRARTRDDQRTGLIVIEDEGLAADIEADAAARWRISSTGRTRHLYRENGNGRRRYGQRALQCRDGHLSEPDQRCGERRKYGRVLNGRARVAGGWRRRPESVAHAAAVTAGRTRTARTKRAAYSEAHANSVATPRREAHRIAAAAAAAKSGAGNARVKRITRTAPTTDAIERASGIGARLTSSGTCPGNLIAHRGRVARARTPTPGNAEAGPSITMTCATPNGGSRTAESAAVTDAGAGSTTLMTSQLDGEAVTMAGPERAS